MFEYREKKKEKCTHENHKESKSPNYKHFSDNIRSNNIFSKNVVQCRLDSIGDTPFSKIYNGIELNQADIDQLNGENYEEIQTIDERSKTGTLYYGNLDDSDNLIHNDLVIIGLKTRFASGTSYYGVNTPGVDREIAFSNKLTLRGYICEDCANKLLTKLNSLDTVKAAAGNKGHIKDSDGKNTGTKTDMASKKWYLPNASAEKSFAEIDSEYQNSVIQNWIQIIASCRSEDITLDSEEKKELSKLDAAVSNIGSLMEVINSEKIVPIKRLPKSIEIDDQMQEALAQKKLLTSNHKLWTVKDEASLTHRLSKNTPLTEEQLSTIHIYDNSPLSSPSSRPINEMITAQMIEKPKESKYKWKVKSLNELGDRYRNIENNRSHEEWLEIKSLWDNPDQKDSIISMWRKTARLHLDSTGFHTIIDNTPEMFQFQDEEKSIGSRLIDAQIIRSISETHSEDLAASSAAIESATANYKWLVSTVRELGDKSADICRDGGNTWKSILKLWNRTHNTKIQYNLDKKWNIWHQTPTEWGMNSTANAGASDQTPFTGWSIFTYSDQSQHTRPVNFHSIRDAEKKHYHSYQTEIYKITQGVAYIFKGNSIERFKQGSSAIIEQGTVHYIVAIEDPYKHLVIQEPSAFHRNDNKKLVSSDEGGLQNDYNTCVSMYNELQTRRDN